MIREAKITISVKGFYDAHDVTERVQNVVWATGGVKVVGDWGLTEFMRML